MIHRGLSILLATYVSRKPRVKTKVSFKRSHKSNGCAALCFALKGASSRLINLWPYMLRWDDYAVMANKPEALRPLFAMLVEPYRTRTPKCPQ
jgi:hypothetical protein